LRNQAAEDSTKKKKKLTWLVSFNHVELNEVHTFPFDGGQAHKATGFAGGLIYSFQKCSVQHTGCLLAFAE